MLDDSIPEKAHEESHQVFDSILEAKKRVLKN